VANNPLLIKLEEASAVITDADKLPNALQSIVKLSLLRTTARAYVWMTSNTSPEIELERTPITWVPEILSIRSCLQARKVVSQWGGNLYFVYLPGAGRYGEKHVDQGRHAVLQAVNKAGVPVIDLHLAFKAESVLGSISVGD
jgi:hypothetical protein